MARLMCTETCYLNPLFTDRTGERKADKQLNHDPRGTGRVFVAGEFYEEDEVLDMNDGEIPGREVTKVVRNGRKREKVSEYQAYFVDASKAMAESGTSKIVEEIREFQEMLGYSDAELDQIVLKHGLERKSALLDHLKGQARETIAKAKAGK